MPFARCEGNAGALRSVCADMAPEIAQASAKGGTGLKPGEFFGRVAGKLVCAGATISEVVHPAARKVPEHSHRATYFSALLGGGYRETFGTKIFEYGVHSIAFHPAGTVHSGEIAVDGARLFAVELEDKWIQRVQEFAPPPPCSHYRAGGELAWLAARLHREFRHGDAAARLTVEGLLLEMLAEASRSGRSDAEQRPAWLRAAVDLLRAEFRRCLTLDDIAEQVGTHPARLSRAFRRAYQQSLGEYVNELRLNHAVRQMAKDVPLSEVALDAGFADQSHFTRVFRARTGTTPAKFRAAQKPKRAEKKPRPA